MTLVVLPALRRLLRPRPGVRAAGADPLAQAALSSSDAKPILAAAAADEYRFQNVTILGVEEHVWHHVSTKPVEHGGLSPNELTGMVDLTRDEAGQVHARLLDPGPQPLDTKGASARMIADQLGHSRVSMTQDIYLGRRAVSAELAEALESLDDHQRPKPRRRDG
jgi:transposase